MKKTAPLLVFCLLAAFARLPAQQVPILTYAVDASGQAHLSVASTEDHYYVLQVRHQPSGAFERATVVVPGKNGTTDLIEPLRAYPAAHYRIVEHLKSTPADSDSDGLDDLAELAGRPAQSPLNAAPAIDFYHGAACIPDRLTFKKLSHLDPNPALGDLEEVKFFIKNRDAKEPILYFINSNTHSLHTEFASALGYHNDGTLMTGSVLFHPDVVAPNGTPGVYRFVFQPNNTFSFAYVQKAMELLAANMPFLKNNFCYYPVEPSGLPLYFQEQTQYDASRVCVLFEADLFSEVDYLALHPAEGYGLLRVMNLQETPGSRDVVLYEALPNDLPRVGGIITTVLQTPLSHVNLRAIQDNVPNAFIRDALLLPAVDTLIGKYVYFKAGQQHFTLREAAREEVDAFYESIRPAEIQVPARDLSQTAIKPLDSISFAESTRFGVKCANVAAMRRFGFPDGTIPEGYGIPFFFYDEFMKFNGFYAKVQSLLDDPVFQSDFDTQVQMLADFRKQIKDAPMPPWMLDALSALQQSFPPGTPIRCRSSTNNEDLPGFSGAGLYDSKTQHPGEGHLSKSIKQVYASMWNFRAFDERSFYRVDHFAAAMGVLVHPNHENERANGVGVSTDPIYGTEGTFYLNTQIGEDLVTNPQALSIPEEILLDAVSATDDDYIVMNASNLVPKDSLIMTEPYLDQMRGYLNTIHREFQSLYEAEGDPKFAMEIEYKIDSAGLLVIKQARPWASYRAGGPPPDSSGAGPSLRVFPNPFGDVIRLDCDCQTECTIDIYDLLGQQVHSERVDFRKSGRQLSLGRLAAGVYFLRGTDAAGRRYFSGGVVKGR